MSTGSGGKPPSGSQPGRPGADTPQRLVVRSIDDRASDSAIMGGDTAVAVAAKLTDGVGATSLSGEHVITSDPAEAVTELVGTTLAGRYLITRKVGQGGMGAVYEATHTLIGKRVAVKVLLEKYAQREAIVRRLKQEAQLASSVGNEHIIDITDFGTTDDGRTFVAMEFLEGESLAECLTRETRLGEQRILHIAAQAANALAAAHAKGIIHRDIKPENLFLLRRKDADFVKVVDFGISKSLRATGEDEDTTRLTQTGMVLGTPLYMSPEQARGDEQVDHRVDVYALGVIMYEAATGRVPFTGNNYLSVISQVLNEDPPPLRELRPDVSEELEAVVMKAMAKDPAERYASANDMLVDLTALLEDPTHSTERAKITGPRRRLTHRAGGPSPARYVVWIAGVAIVLAAVVFSVSQLLGSSPRSAGATTAGPGSAAAVTPPPIPVDAAVAVAPSPPPEPRYETIEVPVSTTPAGATVFCDGLDRGVTPTKVKALKQSKVLDCVARLDGYDDAPFKFDPVEAELTGMRIDVALRKPPKGRPVTRRAIPSGPAGNGATPARRDKTGGEMGGDPYQSGGTGPSP